MQLRSWLTSFYQQRSFPTHRMRIRRHPKTTTATFAIIELLEPRQLLTAGPVAAETQMQVNSFAKGGQEPFTVATEHRSTYASVLQISDQDGSRSQKTVAKINHAPVGVTKTVTTLEDTAYVFRAADFGFSDPHDSPSNNLLAVKIATLPSVGSLTDNGLAVVLGAHVSVVDITAGRLKFTPATNENGAAYSSFTFEVQDNGGTANGGINTDPTPRKMTIAVTPVNDAPEGTANTVSMPKNTSYVFKVTDFGFTDPRDTPPNSFLAVKITTLPVLGKLTDNGVMLAVGAHVTVADITAGKFKFTPVADGMGADYASFTFQVQDNGGTANGGIDTDPTPEDFTISVTC